MDEYHPIYSEIKSEPVYLNGKLYYNVTRKKKKEVKKKQSRLKRIYKLYKGVCFYCNCVLTASEASVDHKIPKSKGGTNKISNLVLSCKPCNEEKSDMGFEEFLFKIRKIT